MSEKTQALAEDLYRQMSDYVGADHEGFSIGRIRFTLDSMEALIPASEQQAQWSSEPPTEPGWYWWRESEDHYSKPFKLVIGNGISAQSHCILALNPADFGVDEYPMLNGEWWPIRIQEPE